MTVPLPWNDETGVFQKQNPCPLKQTRVFILIIGHYR